MYNLTYAMLFYIIICDIVLNEYMYLLLFGEEKKRVNNILMRKRALCSVEEMIPVLNDILFSKGNLRGAIRASWLRNEVISNNIANVDTPGYKRKTVKFEEFLNDGLKTGKIDKGQTRLGSSGALVSVDHASLSYRADGNNVDIENEMAELATNSLRYNTLVQKLNGEYQSLRSVIKGGR